MAGSNAPDIGDSATAVDVSNRRQVPAPPDPAAILTVTQAARLAQVSKRTIYTWIETGKVTICYTAGGRLRVVAGSLFVDEVPAKSVEKG